MRIALRGLLAAALLAGATGAESYELTTHALITQSAYANSSLGDATGRVIMDLGIDWRVWGPDSSVTLSTLMARGTYFQSPRPFGDFYWDLTDVRDTQGFLPQAFDQQLIGSFVHPLTVDAQAPTGASALLLQDWLMRGAIREDDWVTSRAAGLISPNPQTYEEGGDPWGEINRPCNHFFDPVHNEGQSILCINSGGGPFLNPAWAIGEDDPYLLPTVADPALRNHFSIASAVNAEYTALTGMDATGAVIASSSFQRAAYWASTFRSLGDAMHLIEDQAQPQHSRNESHSGGFWNSGIGGHKSVIESNTEARAIAYGQAAVSNSATPYFPLSPPYIPSFSSYIEFWTGRTAASGAAGSLSGSGLADYANHGFFTVANNFGTSYFTSPSSDRSRYSVKTLTSVDRLGVNYSDVYLTGVVPDFYDATQNSGTVPMTRESSWSIGIPLVGPSTVRATYTLDDTIYQTQTDLLLPRAVGYAAGLLNYFFRGRIQISPPASGVYGIVDHHKANAPDSTGFAKIRVTLQNVTDDITDNGAVVAQDMTGGTLTAILKYHTNFCYGTTKTTDGTDLAGEPGAPGNSLADCRDSEEKIVTSTEVRDQSGQTLTPPIALLKSDSPREFQFFFPTPGLPINSTDVYLQIVYRGPFGSDGDAVVVATKDISEPTYFSLFNVTDLMVCIGSVWYKNQVGGGLSPDAQAAIIALGGTPSGAGLGQSAYSQSTVWFNLDPSASQSNPLISVSNLLPDNYVAFAALTDDQSPYSYNIAGYVFPGAFPIPFDAESNGLAYAAPAAGGGISVYQSPVQGKVRGKTVWQSTFGYKYYGTDCTGVPYPTDNSDASGSPFPPPTLTDVTTINF